MLYVYFLACAGSLHIIKIYLGFVKEKEILQYILVLKVRSTDLKLCFMKCAIQTWVTMTKMLQVSSEQWILFVT